MKIGIDIGGSHIGVGLIDPIGKLIIKKERDLNNVDKKENYSKILIDNIINLITQILQEQKLEITSIKLIGIAVPGIVSDTHIIKAENLHIKDFNIVSEINKYFNIPIYLRNDAKCAAIAEKEYGSLKKYKDAVFITLGTGIGGAVFLDGKLLKPQKYEGFEIGHMVIQKDGTKCNCGRKGCFEKYASMKAFKEKIAKQFGNENITGTEIKTILEKNINNEELQEIIYEYIENLSIGLANLINIFEPQVISIGGSFVYFKDILLDKLKERIKQKDTIFNIENIPQIVTARLKSDAGIIGAVIDTYKA